MCCGIIVHLRSYAHDCYVRCRYVCPPPPIDRRSRRLCTLPFSLTIPPAHPQSTSSSCSTQKNSLLPSAVCVNANQSNAPSHIHPNLFLHRQAKQRTSLAIRGIISVHLPDKASNASDATLKKQQTQPKSNKTKGKASIFVQY